MVSLGQQARAIGWAIKKRFQRRSRAALSYVSHRTDSHGMHIDHAAQAFEMGKHAADHARNRGDGFQHDGAVTIAFGKKRVCTKAQQLGKTQCESVGKAVRYMMRFVVQPVVFIANFRVAFSLLASGLPLPFTDLRPRKSGMAARNCHL